MAVQGRTLPVRPGDPGYAGHHALPGARMAPMSSSRQSVGGTAAKGTEDHHGKAGWSAGTAWGLSFGGNATAKLLTLASASAPRKWRESSSAPRDFRSPVSTAAPVGFPT